MLPSSKDSSFEESISGDEKQLRDPFNTEVEISDKEKIKKANTAKRDVRQEGNAVSAAEERPKRKVK